MGLYMANALCPHNVLYSTLSITLKRQTSCVPVWYTLGGSHVSELSRSLHYKYAKLDQVGNESKKKASKTLGVLQRNLVRSPAGLLLRKEPT